MIAAERHDPYSPKRLAASSSARFDRLDNVSVVDVTPLPDDASDALIRNMARGRLDVRARNRIAQRAEGNPLFAEELVRQMLSRPADRDDVRDVPETVAEAVEERLEAAVVGRDFDAALIGRCMALPEEALYRSLRDAAHLGLIDETPDPHVFKFHHALVHEVVYGQILQAERQRFHHRIFSDVEGAPTTPAAVTALAFHAFRSGDRAMTARYNELAADSPLLTTPSSSPSNTMSAHSLSSTRRDPTQRGSARISRKRMSPSGSPRKPWSQLVTP